MSFSLYAATVTSWQQQLGSVRRLIDKAEAFCAAEQLAPEKLIQARLIADMLPFAYQVKSTAVHSLGAIEGVRRGAFSPDRTTPPDSFAGLRQRVDDTLAALAAIDPVEVDGFVGKPMLFEIVLEQGTYRVDYVAEDFLLGFSTPNFYFHATTAYDILRSRGVQIGKADYLGRPRGVIRKPA